MLKPLVMSLRLVFTSTLMLGAHIVDEDFHRLAALPFGFVEIVFFDQRLERAAAGNNLRDAVYLPRQAVFGNRGNDRIGQRRGLDDD